jgi:hypothetical protein
MGWMPEEEVGPFRSRLDRAGFRLNQEVDLLVIIRAGWETFSGGNWDNQLVTDFQTEQIDRLFDSLTTALRRMSDEQPIAFPRLASGGQIYVDEMGFQLGLSALCPLWPFC